MGCNTSKTEEESPQPRKKYSTTTPTARASRSLRFSNSTNITIPDRQAKPQSENNGRRSLSMHTRRPPVQVDYINDPSETDQITAKITRHSPPPHKKSLDQLGSSFPSLQLDVNPRNKSLIQLTQLISSGNEASLTEMKDENYKSQNGKKQLPPLQGVLKKTGARHSVL